MTKLFLDSNVVIYGLDPRAPAKQARCLAWLRTAAKANSLTISPQVCAEARSVAVRKLNLKTEDAAKAILGLLPFCTAPYGADEVRMALDLANKWRLSWWDSLIVASALAARCTHLVTEDDQSAPVIEGLRIIDPFAVAPEKLLGALS